ncbi:MAG TPA: acetate--CoA ligase, partial [Chitinophagaceae bacterium]|nr:acetate--CoA ligase [Chitinophagaceae bacterium]
MSQTIKAGYRIMSPNLTDYDSLYHSFNWQNEAVNLEGLPANKGLNIAYEAVDRWAKGDDAQRIALRWIRKDRSYQDYTFSGLQQLSARFANILTTLGIVKGDRVFSLTGRIPELYIAALGTLKTTAVFCPLFSVFGPEPVFQRLSRGDAKVLITTSALFEKKIKPLMERLPALR